MGKYLNIILASKKNNAKNNKVQDELNEFTKKGYDATLRVSTTITEPKSDIQRSPLWQRPDGSCYACHGTGLWLSVYGVLVCGECHPPANDGLVARWGNA